MCKATFTNQQFSEYFLINIGRGRSYEEPQSHTHFERCFPFSHHCDILNQGFALVSTRKGASRSFFLASSPLTTRTHSEDRGVSAINAQENVRFLTGSPSRAQSTSPARSSPRGVPVASSSSTSSRSPKSSPVPPPPVTRQRNKGLEMSSGMMELFGGSPGTSAFGAGSCFEKLPNRNEERTQQSFGRKNVLEKEIYDTTKNEVHHPLPSTSGIFNVIEDHNAAYERALNRSRKRFIDQRVEEVKENQWVEEVKQSVEIPEPEPEIEVLTRDFEREKLMEDFDEDLRRRLEEEGVDWGDENDDLGEETRVRREMNECPAARILAELGLTDDIYQNPISDLSPIEEVDTPSSSNDWKSEENGLESEERWRMGEPGPDMGGDEEVILLDDEGRVISQKDGEETLRDTQHLDESAEGAEDSSQPMTDTRASNTPDSDIPSQQSNDAATMALLIRGAQVVNDDSVFSADVLIEDGKIIQVSTSIEPPQGAVVVEATGRLLLPAGIDVHTCFSAVDSVDDFKTGGLAAVAGGTATVIELVTPREGESLSTAVARIRKSSENSICHVGISVRVKKWDETIKREMEVLTKSGVNSFALDFEGDEKLYQALEFCKTLGAHARLLPENRSIVAQLEHKMLSLGITGPEGFVQSRPEELEKERVSTICLLSQITNCPVSILSLSSAESATALREGRDRGALAHPEVAAIAVCSDGSNYFNKCHRHAAAHLTESPLRTDIQNQQKLFGTLSSAALCMFASGHKAHSSSSRCNKDFTTMPKGVSGVAERLAILWEKGVRSGRIDPMRFVALSSTNAAKVFNLYPQKGRIAVGADADLVLWDPIVKRRLSIADSHSKADTSPFEGLTVHGGASITIIAGGALSLNLPTHSPHLFAVVQMRDRSSNFEKVDRSDGMTVTNGGGGGGPKREASPFGENQPPTARPRRSHNESSISFGGQGDDRPQARTRNPPGGRTTGLW
ncbi:unnamed protein product, partial [Mesorhabditis belari]|uniref:Amidohydrolase-related domain-containing protein n=1 Tax=Mesorhabditis belari TaxID=2138241 RepID=A0AAF3FGZ9_9BILA